LKLWAADKDRTLAIASAFDIDPFREDEYTELLKLPVYKTISEQTKFRADISRLIDEFITENLPAAYDVASLRTDYAVYCDKRKQEQCNPTVIDLKRNLELFGMNDGTMLYISSNNLIADPREDFTSLANIVSWADFSDNLIKKFMEFTYLGVEEDEIRIDPIVTAMIDEGVAVRARVYLGIGDSDFSRVIGERRERAERRSVWYQ
jgi:hypothetical protein